jgi:hypothetical protein
VVFGAICLASRLSFHSFESFDVFRGGNANHTLEGSTHQICRSMQIHMRRRSLSSPLSIICCAASRRRRSAPVLDSFSSRAGTLVKSILGSFRSCRPKLRQKGSARRFSSMGTCSSRRGSNVVAWRQSMCCAVSDRRGRTTNMTICRGTAREALCPCTTSKRHRG